ncbi:GIY-YIG nuclease family protein [Streptomyces luteocolor]|uniref:GIY-YIG nuclease family protein n=1 Tax=Streptomyces luteocolor TaxID=285500 RepID=UPI000853170A|nr:GIY-YIG nuclease family protein [Streptomyces luteocolor]
MISNHASRWVYLIGSALSRPVKIGVTGNVQGRLDELRTGSPVPLHVMWKTKGDRDLEYSLHEYFAPYRIHGEWFDFGDEDPSALVATAAVLMGHLTHPQRVSERSRLRVVHNILRADETTVIGHLIDAASATGAEVVSNAQAFAYLATVIPAYTRSEGEGESQYSSRVGSRLAKALREERIDLRPVKVSLPNGKRVMGYRLADLKRALAERYERRGRRP